MNAQYIKKLSDDQLLELVKPFWPKSANNFPPDYLLKVAKIFQDRIRYGQEINELSNYFFEDQLINLDLIFQDKQLKNLPKDMLINLLQVSEQELKASSFDQNLMTKLNQLLVQTNQKPNILFSLIRIATTQSPHSPGLSDTMQILGQETCLRRISDTIKELKKQ